MPKFSTWLVFLVASLSASIAHGRGAPDPWWRAHLKVENLKDGGSGDIVINVRPEWAPRAAARFGQMMHEGFLIQSRFFRVVDKFLVQFGMSNDPSMNVAWRRRKMKDDVVASSNTRGTVSFATSGKDSRTTQVFVNTVDNSFLDDQGFAPFGEVVIGMDVVDQIYSGYGDVYPNGRGPDQAKYLVEGGDYLSNNFPKLTFVKELWFDGPEPEDHTDEWIQEELALPVINVGTSEPPMRSLLGSGHPGVALMCMAALVLGFSAQRVWKGWSRREVGFSDTALASTGREGDGEAME